jgi:hypothetical protein
MKYEIWISPSGADNQNKPQVHEKKMIINLLISYKYIEYQNYITIHIGIQNMSY